MRKSVCVFPILVFLIILFEIPNAQQLQAAPKYNALFINSYHYGFEWSDSLVDTVLHEFMQSGLDIDLAVEYMDTKRLAGKQNINAFAALIKAKYRQRGVDILIASDDNAYNFLLEYRPELFPDVPMVFLGVNNYKPGQLAGHRGFVTGLIQKTDIFETAEAALVQNPKANRLVFIHDGTPTGIGDENEFRRILPRLQAAFPELRAEFLTGKDYTTDEMLQKVSKLPDSYVALLSIWTSGRDGVLVPYPESFQRISDRCRVPLYSPAGPALSHGIVGGKVTTGRPHGQAAARMALSILKGTPVSNIPVFTQSVNRYIFDHRQLERWDIDISLLPEGYGLINEPVGIFKTYAHIIWPLIVFLGLQSIIIVYLIVNIRRRKLAEGEMRQLNRSLQESEERYRSLLHKIQAAVVVHGADTKIRVNNPKAEELLGLSRDQLLGRKAINPDWDFLDAEGDKLPLEQYPINRVMNSHRPLRDMIAGIRRPERADIVWVLVNADPVFDDAGNILQVIVTFVDITESKNAQAEREKLQKQLLQAQKMESVGHLAGGIAHDFNNMLSVVIGNTELAMIDLDADDRMYGRLNRIHDAAHRSADLVRQLLAFARKQTVAPKTMNINDTISGMLKMLHQLIGEDIDLKWLPRQNAGNVHIDPSQIDQVLANLMINARDAIDGVGEVVIETENIDIDPDYCEKHPGFIPGRFVMLAVSDNGSGMDEATLAQVFDPFFTTKGIGQGTGLGLATVYGIVKQNNGFVNVYSEPGQGTTVKIYLPAIDSPQDVIPRQKMRKDPKGGNETVLIVEDDIAILELGQSILGELGYNVLTAATPRDAIDLAQSNKGRIDLLVTDVVMPQMNGRQLARRLSEEVENMKCLYMSGYTANVIAHRGVLEEGVHFLPKPISIMKFAAKVREVLDEDSASG